MKNLLLFLPALLNRSLGHAWGPLLAAFFAFSFVASGPYVLNDLFDIEADRLHPTKRRRPFASVVLSILAGLVTALILVVTGFAFCTPAGAQLTLSLLVYAVVSVTYSGFLKNKPVLDVVVLAFMYTWGAGFRSMDFALADPVLHLRLPKPGFSEAFLGVAANAHSPATVHAGKRVPSGRRAAVISQAGVGSGLVAGLILALYVNGPEVMREWPRPYALWGICPIFVCWIVRASLVAHRGNMNEDPIVFAFRDKVSCLAAALILICALLGMTPNAR